MEKRFYNLSVAFVIALIQEILLGFLHTKSPDTRIWILLGGSLPDGIIQAFTFLLFYFGLFEVLSQLKDLKYQEQAVFKHYLPEEKFKLLQVQDVLKLRLKMINLILFEII